MNNEYNFLGYDLTEEESINILEDLKEFSDIDLLDEFECDYNIDGKLEHVVNEIICQFDLNTYVGKDIALPIFQCIKAIARQTKTNRTKVQNKVVEELLYYRLQDYFTENMGIKEIYEYCKELEEYHTRYGAKTARELKAELRNFKVEGFKSFKLYESLEYKDNETLIYQEAKFDYSEGQCVYVGHEETRIDVKEEKYNYVNEVLETLKRELENSLRKLTKDDKEINPSTLTKNEIIQAFNNSITKFIELHYQQPRELKHILIGYKETPINDYVTCTKDMIQNNIKKDYKLLTTLFKQYKKDTDERIYNYDLFAFLYYAYSLIVSFEHLYKSDLLKALGAYKYTQKREKPILKPNTINIFKEHIKVTLLSQYEINLYLKNFVSFLSEVNPKLFNQYILSFLVDMSHNLKASKDMLQSITMKKSFKNVSYSELPKPINTLLLQAQQIAN